MAHIKISIFTRSFLRPRNLNPWGYWKTCRWWKWMQIKSASRNITAAAIACREGCDMCVFAMTGNILVSHYTYSVCAILDCVLCLELGFGCKLVALPPYDPLLCMCSLYSVVWAHQQGRNETISGTVFFWAIDTWYHIRHILAYLFICKTIDCDQSHDLPILQAWTQRCVHASAEVVGHWPSACCPAPRWWMWQASLR